MLHDSTGLHQQTNSSKPVGTSKHSSDGCSIQPKGFGESKQRGDRTPHPKKKKRTRSTKFSKYIVETRSAYLSLWNHRFDYIFAPHPDPGTKPDWQTETRHPLSDRNILQAAYLFGVRPGPETTYALIDIDINSPYHPQNDPLMLGRINEALEPLGLVANIVVTSSDSLGLHIYFPCSKKLPSWQLGLAITTLLENAGFKIVPGWLEVFPNRKPYAADGSYSLFNAHRLPLQQSSYLLNSDLQPVASSEEMFVRHWHHAAERNDINAKVLKRIIKQAQRKAYRVTGRAQKFLNDLNAEIELGWTGSGQTNRLMGRIAMRSYIFGHILGAEAPLTGRALAQDIAKVARGLPGFKEYCRHQKTIDRKARDYARSIESKQRYYHYASSKTPKVVKEGPTENQRRASEAREHIRQVTIELFSQGDLPEKATARFKLLCSHHISGNTLYKNRDLWHPEHLNEPQRKLMTASVEIGISDLQLREGSACAVGASDPSGDTSLLDQDARNIPTDKTSSDPVIDETVLKQVIARNVPSDMALSPIEDKQGSQDVEGVPPPKQLSLNVQWALQVAMSKQREAREKNQQQYRQDKRQRAQDQHVAKLHEWMDSGDPILIAEARQQLARLAASAGTTQGSG